MEENLSSRSTLPERVFERPLVPDACRRPRKDGGLAHLLQRGPPARGDRQQASDLVAKIRQRAQPAAVKQAGNSSLRRSNKWDRIRRPKTPTSGGPTNGGRTKQLEFSSYRRSRKRDAGHNRSHPCSYGRCPLPRNALPRPSARTNETATKCEMQPTDSSSSWTTLSLIDNLRRQSESGKTMVRVIAEIGCNHMGSLDIAKEMISIAAKICRVDAVKFQKRTNRELFTPDQFNAPHPVPSNSFGQTYGEHREALEFNIDQHADLKEYCEREGVIYSTSVWDITAAKEMASLKPKFLKVPSATNLNRQMQDWLCENFEGEIHVSTGMTTITEIENVVESYEERGRAKDTVLYACTSGYPVPFDSLSLLEITRLKQAFGDRVKEVGFSGHHLGIAADIAAMTLGATTIERHFTLDRTWKGTDHAASLEPDGMRRLKRDLENVSKALTYKEKEILDIEAVQRAKLKWEARST